MTPQVRHTRISGGHWYVIYPGPVDLLAFITWCEDTLGPRTPPGSEGVRVWTHWWGPDHLEIEIYDDRWATAFKVRWG